MLSMQDRMWHQVYEDFDTHCKNTTAMTQHDVDDAFKVLYNLLKDEYGIKLTNDDRAEVFIAALTRYIVESN